MYTDRYLDAVEDKAVTVDTFLTRTLAGKAKQYSGRYRAPLVAELERMVEAGEVEKIPSVGNGVAYRRVPTVLPNPYQQNWEPGYPR